MFLVVAFVVFLAAGLLYPIAALFVLDRFGMDQEQFGAMFLKPAVLIGVLSLVAGRLGDRWGHARSVHLGLGVAALSMWALVFLPKTEWVLVIAATGLGLGFVIGVPAWMATIAEVADERWRGTIIGAVATAQGLGAFLGVLVSPALYKMSVPHLENGMLPVVSSACWLSLGLLLVLTTLRPGRSEKVPEGRRAAEAPPVREPVAGDRG